MDRTFGELELRSIAADEVEAFFRTAEPTFGVEVHQEDVEYFKSFMDLDRTFAVFDHGKMVGTGLIFRFTVTTPGGFLPMAGVTGGRVLPSHRRRGVITSLFRRRLDSAREREEPLAGLWSSESAIHGRFGFGWATTTALFQIRRPYARFIDPVDPRGRVTMVDVADVVDRFPPIYERLRSRTPGMLDRSATRWKGWTARDPKDWWDPFWRGSVSPRQFAAFEDRGYVAYRLQRAWRQGNPENRVLVAELMASDREAYAGLWGWCMDLDLTASLAAAQRTPHEPLRLMLADPRRLNVRTADGLWLRLLDVPAALEGRGYSAEDALVIEVTDPAGYANGRYHLETENGKGRCTPSRASADITLPVASLAAAYLGDVRLSILARAGRADEHRPGALRRFDAMFSSDPPPWSPWVF